MWLWAVAAAFAAKAEGFHRLWVDPSALALPAGEATLALDNPFGRRADVRVDGVLIGELAPRQAATLSGLAAREWTVSYRMPDGDGWEVVVTAR